MGRKNPLADKAAEMFKAGNSMADIARSLNIPDSTVRRWKNTYKWETTKSSGERKKSERSDKIKASARDGTKQTMANEELSEKERLFCLYYINSYNATMSYKKAYGCSYETAHAHGYELVARCGVKKEIDRLKEIKRQQAVVSEVDIVELQMRIACSDIGDFINMEKGSIGLEDFKEVDTQLIKGVKEGKYGIEIKMEDRQKAINWLTKYFLMHPDDKYKAEFERKRAEVGDNSVEKLLENMQTLNDMLRMPVGNRSLDDIEKEGGVDEHSSTI